MNIVILQHTFNPTTVGWVRGLTERGHRVVTVVANIREPHGGWPEDMEVLLVPDLAGWVERIGARVLPGRKSAVYRIPDPRLLLRTLRGLRADAVLVKVYSLRNVVALLVALVAGIRRVAWIEQAAPPNREWRVLRRLGVLPRRMFSVIDTRPGGIARPLDRPTGGLPVVTYAPDVVEPSDRPAPGVGPIRILTAAAFWDPDHKRPFWTLEAARDAGILDGRATFTFTGLGREKSPSIERLRSLVAELGIEHLVTIRRNVPYLEMPGVYDTHDVLVLPSAWEQFGMVVPEAMAHGLAVVASDCIGSVGCVVPGVTGELFRVDDRDDLARRLRDLVGDPARIRHMGESGRDFITRHASPTVTAQRLEELLGG